MAGIDWHRLDRLTICGVQHNGFSRTWQYGKSSKSDKKERIMAEKYKAVIFDLFTTLTSLTHLPDAPGRFAHEILRISKEAWTNALFHMSRERLIGNITDPVDIIRDVAWKVDPSVPDALLEETAAQRRIRFDFCLKNPPAGVLDSVRTIKEAGYKLALLSNADVIEAEGWVGSEFEKYFDTAVFSCHVGYMKPDPEIFQICLDRLGLTGPDCLYVGDGGNQELIASAEAGMTAVLTSQFLRRSRPEKVEERERTVNYHIQNLNEILPLLKRLESSGNS
jgi:putative hydrolase of the HAD superfamily